MAFEKHASSSEFVGEMWLGKVAKGVIEGDFDGFVGAGEEKGIGKKRRKGDKSNSLAFLWSSTRLKGGFESKFFGGHCLPNRAAKGTASLHGCLHCLQFQLRLRSIHLQQPLSWPLYRPICQWRYLFRRLGMPPTPQARPPPILRTLDQPRANGIPLHVTKDGKQVFVGFDRKGLVRSLINVSTTDCLTAHVPTAHVGNRQAVHELGQVPIVFGPEHEMPMVGHNQVAQNAHRLLRQRFPHHLLEGREVGILAENPRASIRTIDDVKNHSPRSYTRCSRHGPNLP